MEGGMEEKGWIVKLDQSQAKMVETGMYRSWGTQLSTESLAVEIYPLWAIILPPLFQVAISPSPTVKLYFSQTLLRLANPAYRHPTWSRDRRNAGIGKLDSRGFGGKVVTWQWQREGLNRRVPCSHVTEMITRSECVLEALLGGRLVRYVMSPDWS